MTASRRDCLIPLPLWRTTTSHVQGGVTKDREGNFDYAYDYAGRLLAATHTNGLAGHTQSFTYDAAGRMRTNSLVGAYAYANAGRAEHAPSTITPASGPAQVLTYDANGNMTTGLDGKVMAYDGENRPVSVSFAGHTTTYVYGADGARLKKVESDPVTGTSVTLYLGPVEIRNYGQGAAEEILLYPQPNIRIAKTRSGGTVTTQVFALHADGLGSIRAVTDGAGAAVERTTYRPYGEEVPLAQPLTLPETRGFIGERFDDAAGLQHLNARYYDPRLAMFVQPDWWEVTAPGVGTNRYSYAFNDPVNGRDPGGNGLLKDIADAIGRALRSHPGSTARTAINSVDAARRAAVNDAWKMETQMVQRVGYGTRKWKPHELELLKAGERVPGYVGDHITSVGADITKAADHRNIQFLSKAEHDARHAAPGGTRVPISEDRLIDRTLDGALPDLATEGAKSWAARAGEVLKTITESRTYAVIDWMDPTTWTDSIFRQQTGYGWFEWNTMSWEDRCAADPSCI